MQQTNLQALQGWGIRVKERLKIFGHSNDVNSGYYQPPRPIRGVNPASSPTQPPPAGDAPVVQEVTPAVAASILAASPPVPPRSPPLTTPPRPSVPTADNSSGTTDGQESKRRTGRGRGMMGKLNFSKGTLVQGERTEDTSSPVRVRELQ